MKKFIIIFCCVIILCVLLCIVDYVMVQNDNNPIFCIEVSDGHFIGLGYSFDIGNHPITGNQEYDFRIFGISIRCTITN